MIKRGAVHFVNFGMPRGSAPAMWRPAVIVQSNGFNESLLATVVVVVLTSNTRLAAYPGNVLIPASASGLDRDSVANVTQIATLDQADLGRRVGELPSYLVEELGRGLRLVLGL